MTTEPLDSLSSAANVPAKAAVVRRQRFAEVIGYALQVLGAETGVMLGGQKRLAQLLDVSSTMIHRYKSGITDFDNLHCITLRRLAAAAQLDPGTIYCWIEQGRDAAMEHQRLLSGLPVAFTPLDLVRQLERMLSVASPPGEPGPVLQVEALAAALAAQRQSAPPLFDRLAGALSAEALLAELPTRRQLAPAEWEQLAALLDVEPAVLQERYWL